MQPSGGVPHYTKRDLFGKINDIGECIFYSGTVVKHEQYPSDVRFTKRKKEDHPYTMYTDLDRMLWKSRWMQVQEYTTKGSRAYAGALSLEPQTE
ncbi:MAG: hypothetical protein Ct9H300mP9_8160 [Candidatus Neomarinimicrobiota bacterium]|nr:MAG: hypothetical protein Ct9H300mP9_8160 [Candidatus Neomarinimicrobiota bacterium]